MKIYINITVFWDVMSRTTVPGKLHPSQGKKTLKPNKLVHIEDVWRCSPIRLVRTYQT